MKFKILVIFTFIMCCFSISVNAQVVPGPAIAPSPYATDNLNRLLIALNMVGLINATPASESQPYPVHIQCANKTIDIEAPK